MKIKQIIRISLGIIFLALTVTSAVGGIQWMTNYQFFSTPDQFTKDKARPGMYLSILLTRDQIKAIYRYKHKSDTYCILLAGPSDTLVSLNAVSYTILMQSGQIRLNGFITTFHSRDISPDPAHSAPDLDKNIKYLGIIDTNKPYSMAGAWYFFGASLLTICICFFSFRSYAIHRKKAQAPKGKGFFEGLVDKYPGIYSALMRIQLNGFGIDLVDCRDLQPDGSFTATHWITVAFLPLTPVAGIRAKRLGEKPHFWIPFLFYLSSLKWEMLERTSVDHSRNLRVYLFYYALFLPLLTGPLLGLLLWSLHSDLSALFFWAGLVLCLLWGMFMFQLQERFMKKPRIKKEKFGKSQKNPDLLI